MHTIFNEVSKVGTFIDFPSNFHEFVHSTNSNFFTNPNDLMYLIFHQIFMTLYFQQNQISLKVWTICTTYVHNFPLNFHDLVPSLIFHRIFTTLYIQRIRIFLQIWKICTFNVHNYLLNFHDSVLSIKAKFSTSPSYLYF